MTERQRDRPTWLTEACPSWCTRIHAENDHPEDRVHHSEGTLTPAIVRRSSIVTDDEPGEGAEILTQAMRAVGRPETWILICEPEDTRSMLLLRREAAGDLARSLDRVAQESRA